MTRAAPPLFVSLLGIGAGALGVDACTGAVSGEPPAGAEGGTLDAASPSVDGATGSADGSSAAPDAHGDATVDAGTPGTDASPADSNAGDANFRDAADAGIPDANPADTSVADTGTVDASTGDASDAATVDASDAAPQDAAPVIWFDGGACLTPTAPACAGKTNLLRNPSFEEIPDAGGTGQDLMPAEWLHLASEADTYSNDGSYGLDPTAGGLGDFTGVTAYDGIRWVVAWSATTGQFGQQLTTPLTPGDTYRLEAYLHIATRSDLAYPGTYLIGLWDAAKAQPIEWLGVFCDIVGTSWDARSFTFVAPSDAASRPILVFQGQGGPAGTSYAGLDLASLTDVTTCP